MKIERIVCPHCGREYMPAEIFMPEDLLGKPMEVIRNEAGHIEFYLGDSPDFIETYICDECNTEFKVEANLTFNVSVSNEAFDEEYVSKFDAPKKIKLEENTLFD